MSYNAQRNYQKPPTYGPSANLLTESSPNLSIPAAFRGPQSLRSQASTSTLNQDNRYGSTSTLTVTASISDKFSLAPDPTAWGSNLSPHYPEPDDYLHNPDPKRDRRHDAGGTVFTYRGATNLGCIIVLSLGLVTLFGGYPVISYFNHPFLGTQGGFNIGGINATGQIPTIAGNFGLIDVDTPKDAFTKTSLETGEELQLVFSDEFNVEGRSFYPGDDPYWEAVDLHYWGTNNMEWYDPAAITTADGALHITLSEKETHDLHYQGGMMSTWNKFCFTGGYIEAATILPGSNNVVGLWPAIWTMGNLGRAGYGASLDGTWPYSYDSCDIGTVRNQSLNGKPEMATYDGDTMYDGVLSFLPGQRLSRCTCPDESHPGPIHPDGTYVGRSAPEIDIFEAQISGDPLRGEVSQSGQWAPFNYAYEWFNTSDSMVIYDDKTTQQNTYKGGAFQQSTSGVSWTNQDCYQLGKQCYSVYGFEYQPGYDDGYITWVNDDKPAWTFRGSGTAADTRVEIGPRPVPQEPMYILANLGMSTNFGSVDLAHLHFPSIMSVDYIRVYQPKGAINIGCDPDNFPTQSYIKQYIEAYTNPNLTTWVDDYGQVIPRNSFLGEC